MMDLDKRLVQIVPSQRQIQYQQLEFYSFVHFTVNTFTGDEWGSGKESPEIFNPVDFSGDLLVEAVKSAGMTGLILTCKHHDGFCLWPSAYTSHTIAASPYKGGKGDIVRETADACKKAGIKFGVYLSPWDRNNSCYGTGKEYNDYFINQLTELLTNYGEVFTVWFDGACGEGPNGKTQMYDWDRYYSTIRTLQPTACINVCGPDIRWCGNESGHTREAEWSVVPKRTAETERVAENSQQMDDEAFRQREINAQDRDLGSRQILKDEKDLIWYPAEVNTSIRPGWFYHEEEDDKVRSLESLFDIYLKSVGGNSTFLLNIPPTKRGLVHENDKKRLKELGDKISSTFSNNLLKNAKLTASSQKQGFSIESVLTDDYKEYFMAEEEQTSCKIDIDLEKAEKISYIILKENINLSQRIEKFSIKDQDGKVIYNGTIVGYKKIVKLENPVTTKKISLIIEDFRVCPTLSFIGLY